MENGVKEAFFVRGVLSFLTPGEEVLGISLMGNNQRAITLADNPFSSSNSKHIDFRQHFIREKVDVGEVSIMHVASEDQHADILSKEFPCFACERHKYFVMGNI